ncbi:PAS domain-containing sensor histidine kinase [Luteolibacter arcticus]|uniref:histidine kinase n=1 Tax=Luteolibacter arcticus TaxID=1581411 RepID=A0ABT3GS94_9BACT|nr:PAS domain-containing sensor histidine kinase [Luteolibacter arcticus]MCW1926395.1 PAS domain-containing sensor histidine kinase [Luteolibacter arcticus]
MTKRKGHHHQHPLLRDFADFFEHSLCGHAILDAAGCIVLCNGPLAQWLGHPADTMRGRSFAEFLSIGGKIFHETHLAPLLRMQGHYSEVSLEFVCHDGSRLPVLVNAMERRDPDSGELLFTRLTVFLARERQAYEANLRHERNAAEISLLTEREAAALREQFIAVLGHDLRNPLGAITMGTALLAGSELSPRDAKLVAAMDSSAQRMNELIGNLMDFARFRLGGGIALKRTPVALEKIFGEVIDELQVIYPDRQVDRDLDLGGSVDCDPARLSQILSNLLANALTHGAAQQPVQVTCRRENDSLVLTVRNHGHQIPPDVIDSIFQPFTREAERPSQNGLGLGLYIAAEVAKAHGGTLTAASTPQSTDFIFRMPLA